MLSTALFHDVAPLILRELEAARLDFAAARNLLDVSGAGAPEAWRRFEAGERKLAAATRSVQQVASQIGEPAPDAVAG